MSSSETAPALVVSPTPPSPDTRSFFLSRFGPDVAFADLAGLRRAGLGTLRRWRTASVVATAPADELLLFEDYLVLLAFLVPGARRERQVPGEEPVAARLRGTSLRSALRVAAGLVAGVAALVGQLACGRGASGRRRCVPLPARASTARCLYLKPTLSFGASVGRLGGPRGGRRERARARGHRGAAAERARAAADRASVHPARGARRAS